jgi:hypothetical protein
MAFKGLLPCFLIGLTSSFIGEQEIHSISDANACKPGVTDCH